MVTLQQTIPNNAEPKIFRFSPTKRGSSSSSTTGLLSSSQEVSSGSTNLMRDKTFSVTQRNKVVIHSISSSHREAPPSALEKNATSFSHTNSFRNNPSADLNHAEVFLPSNTTAFDTSSQPAFFNKSKKENLCFIHHF